MKGYSGRLPPSAAKAPQASMSGGGIADVFQPVFTLAAGIARQGNPFKALLTGRLCCCVDEGVDRCFDTQDGVLVSVMEGDDPIGQSAFPTIFKQREGASGASMTKKLSGFAEPRSPMARTATGCLLGSGSSSPKASFVAFPHFAGASPTEIVERPEVDLGGGAKYKGQWMGDERHGHGVLTGPTGERYEGKFVHSRAHGRGRFVEPDGSYYEGEWENDMKHGEGVYTHADGTVYDGHWVEDCKSGSGKEKWTDGAMYQGEFLKGLKHGIGIYRGGGVEYEGQFKADKMHGEGCYKFVGGRKYMGRWENGHMSGFGRMEWPNGSSYEGGYLKDLRHGYGTYICADGKKYVGDFAKGKQHGKGISDDGHGSRRQEVWEHGELVSSEPLLFSD